MSKHFAKRWFRWTLLTIALSGLGVGIYRFTPSEPMCVIEAANGPNKLSVDGHRLATISGMVNSWRGPLQLWDTRTGEEIGSFLAEESNLNHYEFSANGSCFAAEVTREEKGAMTCRLHLVNFASGATRTVSVPSADSSWHLFSPNGEILVRRLSRKAWHGIEIYETASGKLLHQRTTDSFRLWKKTDDIALRHDYYRCHLSDDAARDRFPHLDITRVTQRSYYHPMLEVNNDIVLYHVPTVNVDEDRADEKKDLEIWSIPERKLIGTLPAVEDGPLLINNGRQIMVGRTLPNGKWADQWTVWDVALGRAVAEYPLLMKNPATISPDGRWLAGMAREKPQIELRELATGKLVGASDATEVGALTFSHDGRFLASLASSLTILEVPNMKPLWTRPEFLGGTEVFFSRDSRQVSTGGYGSVWRSWDCETGQSFSLANPDLSFYCVPTPNRKSMMIQQAMEDQRPLPPWLRSLRSIPGLNQVLAAEHGEFIIRVLDTDTRHERFYLHDKAESMAILSDDGGTLVTTHDEKRGRIMFRCWDVDAWKPLHWALGVPAGLAAGIALFALWCGRRALPTSVAGNPEFLRIRLPDN